VVWRQSITTWDSNKGAFPRKYHAEPTLKVAKFSFWFQKMRIFWSVCKNNFRIFNFRGIHSLNTSSQMVMWYHWLAFLNQIREILSPRNLKLKFCWSFFFKSENSFCVSFRKLHIFWDCMVVSRAGPNDLFFYDLLSRQDIDKIKLCLILWIIFDIKCKYMFLLWEKFSPRGKTWMQVIAILENWPQGQSMSELFKCVHFLGLQWLLIVSFLWWIIAARCIRCFDFPKLESSKVISLYWM